MGDNPSSNFSHSSKNVTFKFPNQGSNLCPLHWRHGVLTTGPPGKSPKDVIFELSSHVLFIINRTCNQVQLELLTLGSKSARGTFVTREVVEWR